MIQSAPLTPGNHVVEFHGQARGPSNTPVGRNPEREPRAKAGGASRRVDGTLTRLLGLYICWRPAGNAIDSCFS
jgi:hypothetical protein